jgi:hypothetical protein
MGTNPRGKRLAVYEAPPIPEGWHGRDVIRIIDPLGRHAAWIAPHQAGGVIGYYARRTPADAWIEILAAAGEDGSLGCELVVPDMNPDGWTPLARAGTDWAFAMRDPTSVTVHGTIGERGLAVSTHCDDDGLHIGIMSRNANCAVTNAVGFRIRPRPMVESVERETDLEGAIRFRGGAIAYRHGTHLRCRPDGEGNGIRHIDFVPVGFPPTTQSPVELALTAIPELVQP